VLGVRLPARRCCPEHTAPFEALASAYLARSPIAVWKTSGGFGGESYMLAALALAEAATLGAEVGVLGRSADQSENVVRYTDSWTTRDGLARMLAGRTGGRPALGALGCASLAVTWSTPGPRRRARFESRTRRVSGSTRPTSWTCVPWTRFSGRA
jgi:hypothetical protein